MKDLNLGVKKNKNIQSFTIFGDKSRVVTFNTADPAIMTRYYEKEKQIDEIDKHAKALDSNKETFANDFASLDKEIRETIDYIFAAPISQGYGPSSMLEAIDGVFAGIRLLIGLLEAVDEGVKKSVADINKANIAKHTDKYTKK